jgi:hypothetical protein
MTAHNTGKIKWNILTENIFIDEKNKFQIKNTKAIDYFVNNFFQIIKIFSETKQKKINKNVLIKKYNDNVINPINWCDNISKLYNIEDNIQQKYLIRGMCQYYEGTLLLLVKIYIYLNLILTDFKFLDDKLYKIIQCFYWSDYFPEFFVNEFVSIIVPLFKIIKKNNNMTNELHNIILNSFYKNNVEELEKCNHDVTQEDFEKIKNFTGLIFKCIFLIYKNYNFEAIYIRKSIQNLLYNPEIFC